MTNVHQTGGMHAAAGFSPESERGSPVPPSQVPNEAVAIHLALPVLALSHFADFERLTSPACHVSNRPRTLILETNGPVMSVIGCERKVYICYERNHQDYR